jgi:hypothetical protein
MTIRCVSAADIDDCESLLPQNSSGHVSPLPDLAIGGDFFVRWQFTQSRSQFIDGDVDGIRNVTGCELFRSANIQQERSLIRRHRHELCHIDLRVIGWLRATVRSGSSAPSFIPCFGFDQSQLQRCD